MDEINETFDEHRKKSTLDRLYEKINQMLQVDFSEFGDLSDAFKATLEEEIKELFRKAIAEVCGISVEDVTDEYIRVAQMTLPIGGKTEDGKMWDGIRHLTDEELIEQLKPLIERDHGYDINVGTLKTVPTGGMTEDGSIWDGEKIIIDEEEKPILIDKVIDIYYSKNVNDVIKALFDKYYKCMT